MVKCKDCKSHIEEGNKCNVLAAPLSFSPDTEVVCPKFEPKQPEPVAPAKKKSE